MRAEEIKTHQRSDVEAMLASALLAGSELEAQDDGLSVIREVQRMAVMVVEVWIYISCGT